MIDKSVIDEISKNTSIVKVISNYFNLTKKGKYFFALCPFHNDTHPSLQIDPERNTFHCWVDGHYGNAFSFIMQYENVGFVEAVKKVAGIIGFENLKLENKEKKVDPKLKLLFDCINDLNLYYEYCLIQNILLNENLKKYLNDRKITKDIIEKFHLGYSDKNSETTINFLRNKGHSIKTIDDIGFIDDNNRDINRDRLIFPIFNNDDKVIGFSARKINEDKEDFSPKYINSKETKIFVKKKIFYNFNNAKKTFKLDKYIYILEGFMDVIALNKIGINSAVAIMGTNLSNEHIKILKKMNVKVYLCFDNDLAGKKATINAISLLKKTNIETMVVNYIDNEKDSDDILKNKGPEVLKKNLKNLITSFEFEVFFYKNILKNKNKIIDYFMNFFLEKNNDDNFDDYINKFSEITKISPLLVKRKIEKKIFYESKNIKTLKIEEQKNNLLKNIEKTILHYMFYYCEAIEFFVNKIDHFYTKSYNEIANYIVDYYLCNKKLINLDDLITNIEFAFSEKKISSETKKEFDLLIFYENETKYRGKVFFPTFDQNLLIECEKLIRNYKNKLYEEELFNNFLETKSDEEIMNYFDQKQKDVIN